MYTWQANSRANERDMMNTSVYWGAMMMAVDSSSACFACRKMRVSASSCVLYKLSTSLGMSFVTLKHFLSQFCYKASFWVIASASLEPGTLWDCFCFWVRTKDASTALLCGQRLCCWKEYPRLTLSAFFMHSSRCTSNTTSIRELSAPVRNADMKMASESSAKVLLWPWTFWTRLIPSMMQVDGCRITSANDRFFSSCRASVDLLVFFSVPSQLPSDHGNGPSGSVSTDFRSNLLLVAVSTIWLNKVWSAFRAVSLF